MFSNQRKLGRKVNVFLSHTKTQHGCDFSLYFPHEFLKFIKNLLKLFIKNTYEGTLKKGLIPDTSNKSFSVPREVPRLSLNFDKGWLLDKLYMYAYMYRYRYRYRYI